MPAMEIFREDIAQRIAAGVRYLTWCNTEAVAGSASAPAIEDHILENVDRVLLAVLADALLHALKLFLGGHRKEVGKGVERAHQRAPRGREAAQRSADARTISRRRPMSTVSSRLDLISA